MSIKKEHKFRISSASSANTVAPLRGNSDRYHFVFRYLLAICVPVLCVALLLLYFDYKNQIMDAQDKAMSQLGRLVSEVDYCGSSIEAIALHMSGNDKLTLLDTSKFDPTTYASNRVFGLLVSYEKTLSSGISMLYYLRGGTYIYSNEKFFSYNDFVASADYDNSLGRADLYLRLNSITERKLQGLKTVDDTGQYCALLYYPIPEIDDAPNATVCFLIHRDFAADILYRYYSDKDTYAIVTDPDGEIIFSNVSALYTAAQAQELMANNTRSGVMRLTISGESYIFLRERSGNSGLNYGILIPRTLFYQDAGRNFWSFFALIFLLILLSCITALFLAYSHYSSAHQAAEEMTHVSEQLRARNFLIREMVLKRLVKGTIKNRDDETLAYNLRCANLQFEYPLFAVVVCELNDMTLHEDTLTQIIDALDSETIEEANLYAVHLEEENRLVAILNFDKGAQRPEMLAGRICAIWAKQQLLGYAAGMGSVYDSPFGIDDSYVEGIVAIHEAMPAFPCGIHLFFKQAPVDDQTCQFPYVEYALIEQSIRNGNADIAFEAVRHAADRIDHTAHSVLIQKCLRFDLINMIIKVASSSRQPLSPAEITQLSSWDTTDGLLHQMDEIIRRLTQGAKEENDQQQKNAKHELINYVQNHYQENTLTLEKLAAQFSLSYTYVSKVFKEETGQSFLSYLTQLRMQYIKHELLFTDKAIKDIAAEAGYNDLTNFMRKFKSVEGITPGQFRRDGSTKA